jgi:hypothetical protein
MHHHTHLKIVSVTAENFYPIFMDDTSRDMPFQGAPICPLVPGGTCDCRNELLQFALASGATHQCGVNGKCPVRTYLNAH